LALVFPASSEHAHQSHPDFRAGAESIQPPTDQPYGDRSAEVRDPFGNLWFIATHIRDVAP